MRTDLSSWVVQHNGREAAYENLGPLAFAGHAHFTAMQVRQGGVRGLDLHLERLRNASKTLFRQAIPDEKVREYLRTALKASPQDFSLVATVYSPAGEFTLEGIDAAPEMLIRTGPASSGPKGALKMAVFEYERVLPAIKHVGEVAKTYYLRKAAEEGFDDAAFVDRHGRLGEASIWNLAFWDGEAVVWPRADVLRGVTMTILWRQLERMGVRQKEREITLADVSGFSGAVVMNSWTPGIPVRQFGTTTLPESPAFWDLLHRAYNAEPLVAP